MKIVVAEKIAPAAVALLRQESAWTVVTPEEIGNKLLEHLADADALSVRSAVDVNAALLEHARQLRVIGRAGVGVDNVDVPAATKRGVIVVNSPEGNTIAAAEHALALMLSLSRHVPHAHASTMAGGWDRTTYVGTELYKKKLGVVGLGKIGPGLRAALSGGAPAPDLAGALVSLGKTESLARLDDALSLKL